jgi:membrane protease YdiL (CAAX protease family)
MSDLPLPEPVRTDQALDIQHDIDPAQDHGNARRIPHLGHAAMFFLLAVTFIFMASFVMLIATHSFTPQAALQHPVALVMSLVVAYALTLAVAIPVFPLLWRRPFFDGISWTWRAAQLRWWKLVLLGCGLAVCAEAIEFLLKFSTKSDIAELLKTPAAAWLTVAFGTLMAPVCEEIAFRGFLMPALATAYDWISLERTPTGLHRWQSSSDNTRGAWIFGAVLSSAAFMWIHGSQLHWATGPLAVLFVMSLVFSAVRVVTRSVAASTIVHIAYDGLLLLQVVIVTHGFHNLSKL